MNPYRQIVNILLSLFHTDVFVQLDLKPHRKVIVQDKPYKGLIIAARHRREEDLTWNLMTGDNISCVLAICLILNHKLNRILLAKCIKQPNITLFSRGWTFDIHAYRGVRLQPGEIDCAVCFDINNRSPLVKRSQQLFKFISLQEWLSSRNADIGRFQMPDLLKNTINAHFDPAALCVCGITPLAMKVTVCKPDKQAGFSLIFSLSLEAPENFCNLHSVSSAQAVGDSQTRIFDILALIPRFLQTA